MEKKSLKVLNIPAISGKKKSTYNVDNIIKSISQLREPKQFPQFSAV